jgi:hypothetical protein
MQYCCQAIIFLPDTRKGKFPILERNMSLFSRPIYD